MGGSYILIDPDAFFCSINFQNLLDYVILFDIIPYRHPHLIH